MAVTKERAVRTATGHLDRTELKAGAWQKAMRVVQEDTSGLHPRLLALNFAARLLPPHSAAVLRARLMALAGFRVGEGTRLLGVPKISGGPTLYSNLTIGRACLIDADCVFDAADNIAIGDRVTLDRRVMLLTSTHELDIREHRAGATQLSPVKVGDGAWLGAWATVLPGVTIGEGAVVDAGAVVNKDVAPWTRFGGVPAALRQKLRAEGFSGS